MKKIIALIPILLFASEFPTGGIPITDPIFGDTLTGYYSSEQNGRWRFTYVIYGPDTTKITSADTLTYGGMYIGGSNLHSFFIGTDDDSVKVQYREALATNIYTDWQDLVSYPVGAKVYTLYLDYAIYLQIRIIGLGNDSTTVGSSVLIGSIR